MAIKLARVRIELREPITGSKVILEGNGTTKEDAKAEFDAIAAMTVASNPNAAVPSITDPDAVVITLPTFPTGQNETGVFVFAKTGRPTKIVRKRNLTTAISDGLLTGKINKANSLVTAFASAWSDGNGEKGYTLVDAFWSNKF